MVTAASSGSRNITGFAIPIATALTIVDQIEAGVESGSVTLGVPAFLGVTLTESGVVASVVGGMPAALAGLAAGDTITAFDGMAVATSLADLIGSYEPGDMVTLSFTDAAGAAQTTTATLVEGPAS